MKWGDTTIPDELEPFLTDTTESDTYTSYDYNAQLGLEITIGKLSQRIEEIRINTRKIEELKNLSIYDDKVSVLGESLSYAVDKIGPQDIGSGSTGLYWWDLKDDFKAGRLKLSTSFSSAGIVETFELDWNYLIN